MTVSRILTALINVNAQTPEIFVFRKTKNKLTATQELQTDENTIKNSKRHKITTKKQK